MSGYWVSGLSYLQRDIGNGRDPLWRLLGNPAWRCGLWEVMGTGSGCRTVLGPCPPQKPAHASNGRDEKTMRTLLCKTRCCPECVCVFWRRQWCFLVRQTGFFNQLLLFSINPYLNHSKFKESFNNHIGGVQRMRSQNHTWICVPTSLRSATAIRNWKFELSHYEAC